MKILFVTRPICPPWDEASKNFVYNLAKNIRDAQIYILTCQQNLGLEKNVHQEKIFKGSEFAFKEKFALIKYLFKASNFDIFHFTFTPTNLNSLIIKNIIRNKKAKTIQTVATLREDLYSPSTIKKMLFSDIIVVYSEYASKKLKEFGFSNVRHVYPGIDLNEYQPKEKNSKLIERCNIKPEDFVLCFPGEYTRLGAIDDVIEAFHIFLKKFPRAKLLIACRIKNKEDLRKKYFIMKRVAKEGFSDKVNYLDDQDYKMSDVYNLADILLFPVRNLHGKFDIPLVLIEAMACGVPVIASREKKLTHFLAENNCVFVSAGRPMELSEAIEKLAKDSNKREYLSQAGRQFVKENFDIKKAATEYVKIYHELVNPI